MFNHLHQNLERNSCNISPSLCTLCDVERMSRGCTDNFSGNLRVVIKNLNDIINQFGTIC